MGPRRLCWLHVFIEFLDTRLSFAMHTGVCLTLVTSMQCDTTCTGIVRRRVTPPHGRVRLSLIHSLVQHATMVACPIRLQERCEMYIARVSANGSRPEHGPESAIRCDGSHPLLFFSVKQDAIHRKLRIKVSRTMDNVL